jgi:hypothetical protein
MVTRRSMLQLAPVMLLTWNLPVQRAAAALSQPVAQGLGQRVRRISRDEQTDLRAAVEGFCGQTRSNLIPDAGPLLIDQFRSVGFIMDEYTLPGGRTILNHADGRAGLDSVVVMGSGPNAGMQAAAFLTHLYPAGGLDEHFITPKGIRFQQHFSRQWDYSLIILYARGSTRDPKLNADLTAWAKARAGTTRSFVSLDRSLKLKRFVRVLKA